MLRSGVRVSSRNFVARALLRGDVRNTGNTPNTGDSPRLGLIAGKKAAPRAVDRNRAKRLVREIFRAQASAFGPIDVTVQLRTDLRSHNNESVRSELRGLLESLARRCGSGSTAPKPAPPAGPAG